MKLSFFEHLFNNSFIYSGTRTLSMITWYQRLLQTLQKYFVLNIEDMQYDAVLISYNQNQGF